MENIIEISNCQRCGKAYPKKKLHMVEDFWLRRELCKDCYVKYHRFQWGYW